MVGIKRIVIVVTLFLMFAITGTVTSEAGVVVTPVPVATPSCIDTDNDKECSSLSIMRNIADTIGADKVYNGNYRKSVNAEIMKLYAFMEQAENECKDKNEDKVREINEEYKDKTASILSQKSVKDFMIYNLRVSYCHRIVEIEPEMNFLIKDTEKDKKNFLKEEKKAERNYKIVDKVFIALLVILVILSLIPIVLLIIQAVSYFS